MQKIVKSGIALLAVSLLAACPTDVVTTTRTFVVEGKTYTVITEETRGSYSNYTTSNVTGPGIGFLPCDEFACEKLVRRELSRNQSAQQAGTSTTGASPFEEESGQGD